MKPIRIVLCVSLFLAFCLTAASEPPADTVTQVSTIDALLAGVYGGHLSCGELLGHGDLGIGTFRDLDGEMVVSEGRVYQVRADGHVYEPSLELTTPFASVVRFLPDRSQEIEEPTDLDSLKRVVDKAASNQNLFCAIRIKGLFSSMKTRSVPAQHKPYPPLAEVTERQPVFEMADVTGTIVGFRSPPYVKGINVPGYHLHFLSDDRTCGGHILDFTLETGTVEIDVCNRLFMILPVDAASFGEVDLSQDRTQDLEKAEK